jgi:cardiolipin synthase
MNEIVTQNEEAHMPLGSVAEEDACGGIRAAGERSHGAILTIPNLVTFIRLLLLFPLFYFLKRGTQGYGNSWALLIIAAALFTDILDGFLARVLKQETDWGRTFDPLADKIWIAGLGIFLALHWRANPLPWGFLVLILVRDALIVAGGIHIYRKKGIVPEANMLGKIAMFMTSLTLLSYTVNFAPLAAFPWVRPRLVLWLSVVCIVLSGLAYFVRYRATVSSASLSPKSSPSC